MMDEEIRQALTEVREMKKMCGNINMKLTNIVTQRGQDFKKKLEAEYQKGFEDGKAVNDKGCEGCKYANVAGTHEPCVRCSNSYGNQWTAKDDKIEVGDEVTYKSDSITWTAVVTQNVDGILTLMGETGAIAEGYDEKCYVKTGRHFDIQSILEAMKHD